MPLSASPSPTAARRGPAFRIAPALRARMSGPGGYYNIGNLLGLVAGAAWALASARPLAETGGIPVLATLADYFLGNPSAAALSCAMAIFFVSGEAYHQAWRDPARSRPDLVRLGDLLSAVAASALCVSLVLVGNTALALVSSALLVGGKLGSALMPGASWIVRPRLSRPFDPFRLAVVLSRIPGLLSVLAGLASLGAAASPGVALQSLALLACYALWLRADLLLLRPR